MKTLLALILLSTTAFADNPKDITGTIEIDKKIATQLPHKGVLFIFARKSGQQGGPPAAVVRVPSAHFPFKFRIGPESAMIPNTPFDGPFKIHAKLTAGGNAMQKSGALVGVSSKEIKPGSHNVVVRIDQVSGAKTNIKMH